MNHKVAENAETRRFDAEVEQLLKLMVNALYSNREIFLRELISNASDALDKLRFEALTDDALHGLDQDPEVLIEVDREKHRLSVSDNGVGMSRDEIIENLGTIARSGTARFLEALKQRDSGDDARLIGQFGVGFYSAFIVSDRVTVESRRAGQSPDQAVRWSSDGHGEYTLEPVTLDRVGTRVTLEIAQDHRDLLEVARIKDLVRHYSNHISFPIRVAAAGEAPEEPINDTGALWTRPKGEVGADEYREFYQSISGDTRDPVQWAHHHVEGSQSYSMLLFLPGQAPFDLAWNRDQRRGLKLYIQRVFIMDAAEQLIPRYLRFVRGVVDSADLPLNVSREILQQSPLLDKIRAALVKRTLNMIEKLADAGGDDWTTFCREFGSALKEGIVEDPENREQIARLLRFSSSRDPAPHAVPLNEYLNRADASQDAIWYLTGDNLKQLRDSPHLEAFEKAGVEVLLLDEPIDVWLVNHLDEFEGKPLKSAASGEFSAPSEDSGETPDEQERDRRDQLCGRIKKALADRVGNVRISKRLTESASCIAEDAGGMNMQMRRMLRHAGQELPTFKPDLEINPDHPLVAGLGDVEDEDRIAEYANLLLDQALLIDGGELADPAGFVKRVNRLLAS